MFHFLHLSLTYRPVVELTQWALSLICLIRSCLQSKHWSHLATSLLAKILKAKQKTMLWTLTFNIYVVCFLWRGRKCFFPKQAKVSSWWSLSPRRRHHWQPSTRRPLPSEGRLQISSRGHGRTPVWSRRSHRRCRVWRSRGTSTSYKWSWDRTWLFTCFRRKAGWWGCGPRPARRASSRPTSLDPSNPEEPVTPLAPQHPSE